MSYLNRENIADLHAAVIESIYKENYYVDIFISVTKSFSKSIRGPIANDPELICEFWNKFWYALPDSLAIRRTPFYSICELAEGEYLDDSCQNSCCSDEEASPF